MFLQQAIYDDDFRFLFLDGQSSLTEHDNVLGRHVWDVVAPQSDGWYRQQCDAVLRGVEAQQIIVFLWSPTQASEARLFVQRMSRVSVKGEAVVTSLTWELPGSIAKLTRAEWGVFQSLGTGVTIAEIAAIADISPVTVRAHLRNASEKTMLTRDELQMWSSSCQWCLRYVDSVLSTGSIHQMEPYRGTGIMDTRLPLKTPRSEAEMWA